MKSSKVLAMAVVLGLGLGFTGTVDVATAFANAPVSQGPAKVQTKLPPQGMRRPRMSNEKATAILNENYGFPKDELLKAMQKGHDYREMDRVCLYAYMTKKPWQEVLKMRDVYTWERLRFALGLKPQVFFDKQIEYDADRLYARCNIDRKITIKYMKMGFPMHHVNMAGLLAPKCHRSVYDIMMMKTPKNTWNDVAIKLGLTIQDCQEVKDAITKAFKRR